MANVYSEAIRLAIATPRQRDYANGLAANIGQPTMIRQSFDVTGETVDLQMLAWSDYVGRILDVPVSRRQVASGFEGRIDTCVLNDMVYVDSRTDPMIQARTAARISTDGMQDYVFHVAIEGIADTVTGTPGQRRSTQFVPGILALDMCQTMRMERPTRARVLAFFLPRAMVESAIPHAESIHGRVIAYSSPLMHLIREHLVRVCRDLPGMADADAQGALRASAQLILAVFARQARLSESARAAARSVMLDKVKHYIHTNLERRDLDAVHILERFPLARPTLYRMFEHEGGLGAYIRHCRLRAAAGELTRPTPVARIAEQYGFNSPSDFTRAFRRAFGVAPMEFRSLELEWARA